MKRVIAIIMLAVTIILTGGCGKKEKAPDISEIEPRLRELIEASYEINEIFFGKGLEVYPNIKPLTDRPLAYDAEKDFYYLTFEDAGRELLMYYKDGEYLFAEAAEAGREEIYRDVDTGKIYYATEYEEPKIEYVYSDDEPENYLVVKPTEKYYTIDMLKEAAGDIYTKSYLDGIYQGLFDGVAYSEGMSAGIRRARFIEYDSLLRQAANIETKLQGKRIYKYETLKIVSPSDMTRVNLTVDTYIEGKENETVNINLCMIKESDGQWYLDTPTY